MSIVAKAKCPECGRRFPLQFSPKPSLWAYGNYNDIPPFIRKCMEGKEVEFYCPSHVPQEEDK